MSALARAGAQVVALALAFPVLLPAQESAPEHQHQEETTQPQSGETHDHAQHDANSSTRLPNAFLPVTPIPPLGAADRAAALEPPGVHSAHDNAIHAFLLVDQVELQQGSSETGMAWRVEGWAGTDLHRLWLHTEGARAQGSTEAAQFELLYGRGVSRWWDVLAGVRHDEAPGPARDFLAIGVQGIAPQWIETRAMAYLGQGGRTGLHLELEHELLFTNRLVLQPLAELQYWSKADISRSLGRGLSHAGAGLRLRYEITRRFAPYVGVAHERTFGATADLRRLAGQRSRETRAVAGLRIWF